MSLTSVRGILNIEKICRRNEDEKLYFDGEFSIIVYMAAVVAGGEWDRVGR
jgi:hypothetical protein